MKRRLILAVGLGVLTVGSATSASALSWTPGFQSVNAHGYAKAVTLANIPAGQVTSTRPKKNGTSFPRFVVGTAAPGATGYRVVYGTSSTLVCEITAPTGNCMSTVEYNGGGHEFRVTPIAGTGADPWVASAFRTCDYHDENDEAITCT